MVTRIISADCHINEPPWVFDRVPQAFKDRTPKMMRGSDGGDGWSFDGKPPKRTFGVEAMAGRKKEEFQVSGLKFEDILPGNYDGAAHVADMDSDDVDVSVVYPCNAIFTYLHPDRELALHCMRSYNDWMLEDFQGANPARIVGLPMLPVDDGMEAAVAEFDRCAAKGAKGMFLPGLPVRPYNDEYYEPLWQRANDTGIPVTFHRTFGGKPQDAQYDEILTGKINLAGTVFRFFAGVKPLTYMIYGGVFERFPGLKLVVGEVNHGWVPFWMQTMDETYSLESAWAHLPISRKPSEYCGTNVFVTSLDDYVGYDMISKGWPQLADMVMYSTDYPHSATLWPNTSEYVAKLMHNLTPEQKDKICSGNAARVYGI
ncbi:MAG: amidohydrolase family protein [Micromonosporaceae bacterium]